MQHVSSRLIFIFASILILFSRTSAYAETEFTVEPNIGFLSGFTKYNISGIDLLPGVGNYSWASELEWPVNGPIWGVNASITVDKRFALEAAFRENLDKDSGKMKDSDWINNALIIYSESDTGMRMQDLDIRGRYIIPQTRTTSVGIFGGFRYQKFSFEARNLVQRSVDPSMNATVPGLVGKYDVRYSIPYIGAGFSSKVGEKTTVDVAASLGYVRVNDEDDHVLRYKKSVGESTGRSVGISWDLIYNLSSDAYIKLNNEYLFIQANGTQSQTWYATTSEAPAGTTISGIDLKIESFQALATIGLGIRF